MSRTQASDKTIFDRMGWYERSEVFEQAKKRFSVLMAWLYDHDMLNEDGRATVKSGIQDDFLLYDGILTSEGTSFLKIYYEDWVFTEGLSDPITTRILDAALMDWNQRK